MIKITAVAAAALGLAAASSAQTLFDSPSNIALRIGIAFPTDGDTRSFLNDPLNSLGLDYFVPRAIVPGANGETVISVDWLSKGITGNTANFVPVTINQRWYDNSTYTGLGDPRSYYSLGAGIAFVDINGSDTALALRGAYGYEFSTHLFAEAAFTYMGDTSGFNGTNFGINFGYRF
jgi:hypothetical protein